MLLHKTLSLLATHVVLRLLLLRFNNPKGPLYIMQTTDINTIMYQNGTIKVYDNTRKSAPGAAVIPSAQDPNSLIVKKDNYYFLGEQQMDEAQYVEFI